MKAVLLATLLAVVDVDAPSRDAVSAIANQLAPFQTIHGDFTQRKVIKIIHKPLISRGKFVLVRGKGLLWHTQKPFDSMLRIDPSGIATLKDGKVRPILSTHGQPGMKQVSELLLAVSGDLHALDPQFHFEDMQAPSGAPWHALLRPRDSNVAKFVVSVTVRGQKTAQSLELIEANGDITEIHLNDVSIDAPLSTFEKAQF